MKPIHKFNNGIGATICNQCSVIITTGLTDDLYCKECKDYRKKLLIEIMKEDEDLGLYIEQMEKEEPKQQTLEEAAERIYREYPNNPLDKPDWRYNRDVNCFKKRKAFIAGAKWQQEISYSEEEVRNIVEQTIEKFYKHRYVETKSEMKELWFEQFKKK